MPPKIKVKLPADIAFLGCKGCKGFICMHEKVNFDPKVLLALTNREELCKNWFTAHKLTWLSCGFNELTCNMVHLHPNGQPAKLSFAPTVGDDKPNQTYTCNRCRQTYPAEGPFIDNYGRSGYCDKVNMMMLWCDGEKLQEGEKYLGHESTLFHFQLIERVLATWMIYHMIDTTEWFNKKFPSESKFTEQAKRTALCFDPPPRAVLALTTYKLTKLSSMSRKIIVENPTLREHLHSKRWPLSTKPVTL
eukprot:GILJ01015667.1.p1 GENE.GILJ01015667.1~~GILJ01015667.1.p1  ORF type:complete len:248 (-),score=19.10 GILJ01015667.1:751-1494(-)